VQEWRAIRTVLGTLTASNFGFGGDPPESAGNLKRVAVTNSGLACLHSLEINVFRLT
jgi:hypothetical protein